MSLTIKTNGGALDISSVIVTRNDGSASYNTFTRIYVDGVFCGIETEIQESSANQAKTHTNQVLVPVSAGVHKIDVYWYVDAGTASAFGTRRILTAREI